VSVSRLKIGEVHALLREDFPTIELSKIRYYEEKGLVRPARSRKGYRLYGERDVACLREAIRLAQEEFVPLRVVRQRLIEQGLLDDDETTVASKRAANEPASNIVSIRVPNPMHVVEHAAPRVALSEVPTAVADVTVGNFGASSPRLSENELLAAASLSASDLRELISFGFLTPREVAGRMIFDECDLIVAKRFSALSARGVDARHLQPLKRVVERQVDLLSDLTAPLRQQSERRGVDVIDEVRTIHDEIAALRSALLTRALQEYFGH
jgi:DNA-binding transcriptional MerR regulator